MIAVVMADQVLCWERGRPARNEREARKQLGATSK